jgi:hypothetical protein
MARDVWELIIIMIMIYILGQGRRQEEKVRGGSRETTV